MNINFKKLVAYLSLLSLTLVGCNNKSSDTPSSGEFFKVVWKNYNGAVLETDNNVAKNTTPTYDGRTPTRPDDDQYTYTWNGWNPRITPVTSNQTYTATFSKREKEPGKVIVPAHTLNDNNPPITIGGKGDIVSEATWNSFKNGAQSKFSGHYNYTYTVTYRSPISRTTYKFTKNGYYFESTLSGAFYYERKGSSGNTFYKYSSTNSEWLREEETFDLENEYTYRIWHAIYVDHLDEYSNYEYDESDGLYSYSTSGFAKFVKFQNGYITYLSFGTTSATFVLDASFDTEIEIPKSYYYK